MSRAVLRRSQIVPEAVVGTAVPPTSVSPLARQLSGTLTMKDAPERRLRESRRASMFGPDLYDDMAYLSTGSYTGRLVYNELPYFLASSIRGDVAPTTPAGSAKLWTYTQPATIEALKSMTVYVGDNTKALRAAGVFTDRLEISGTDTDWIRINAGLIGRQCVVDDVDASTYAFNTALTTGTAEGAKNKKTILYIDATGAGIGTTIKSNTGYSFRWVFDSGIAPDYAWTTGGLDWNDIHRDVPEVTLELTTKWDATAVAEFKARRDLTPRFIRIQNSGSDIATAIDFRLRLDGCYIYTDFEPLDSERDGTQLGRLMLAAVEDRTWTKKSEVSIQNLTTITDLPVV